MKTFNIKSKVKFFVSSSLFISTWGCTNIIAINYGAPEDDLPKGNITEVSSMENFKKFYEEWKIKKNVTNNEDDLINNLANAIANFYPSTIKYKSKPSGDLEKQYKLLHDGVIGEGFKKYINHDSGDNQFAKNKTRRLFPFVTDVDGMEFLRKIVTSSDISQDHRQVILDRWMDIVFGYTGYYENGIEMKQEGIGKLLAQNYVETGPNKSVYNFYRDNLTFGYDYETNKDEKKSRSNNKIPIIRFNKSNLTYVLKDDIKGQKNLNNYSECRFIGFCDYDRYFELNILFEEIREIIKYEIENCATIDTPLLLSGNFTDILDYYYKLHFKECEAKELRSKYEAILLLTGYLGKDEAKKFFSKFFFENPIGMINDSCEFFVNKKEYIDFINFALKSDRLNMIVKESIFLTCLKIYANKHDKNSFISLFENNMNLITPKGMKEIFTKYDTRPFFGSQFLKEIDFKFSINPCEIKERKFIYAKMKEGSRWLTLKETIKEWLKVAPLKLPSQIKSWIYIGFNSESMMNHAFKEIFLLPYKNGIELCRIFEEKFKYVPDLLSLIKEKKEIYIWLARPIQNKKEETKIEETKAEEVKCEEPIKQSKLEDLIKNQINFSEICNEIEGFEGKAPKKGSNNEDEVLTEENATKIIFNYYQEKERKKAEKKEKEKEIKEGTENYIRWEIGDKDIEYNNGQNTNVYTVNTNYGKTVYTCIAEEILCMPEIASLRNKIEAAIQKWARSGKGDTGIKALRGIDGIIYEAKVFEDYTVICTKVITNSNGDQLLYFDRFENHKTISRMLKLK